MNASNFDIFWKNKIGLSMTVAIAALFVWSAIAPYSRGVWYVEITTAAVPLAIFVFLSRNFKFSITSYVILGVWEIMQIVGAHYTFELVPFGFVSDLIGASRNHYDRIAHFMVGVNSYLVAEYAFKRGVTNGVGASAFFGLIAIMAFANLWELIEWTYAEIDGGEVGAAFLGSQGDVGDAQKDMLMDTLGGIVGAFLFCFTAKK